MPVATSVTEQVKPEEVVDDVSSTEVKASEENKVDLAKLAQLRAQSQAKQQESKMAAKIVSRKERSIALGVLGSGQAGSRLAEAFYQLGYDSVVVNTAMQDLKYINIPDANKLLMEYGLGGAAKEIEIGRAAAESHRGEILQMVNEKLGNSQVNLLCLSLGGGSGAGSCETLVDVLSSLGKPLVVITVLPMDNEDAQTKTNALETLSKLAKMAQSKKVNNLIVVDNAKLEVIYHNVSQMDFFGTANKAIVEPIDIFNTLSSMPSSVKGLDPMEWGKLFTDGEGLTVYGELTVDNFSEDTAIAEAVVNNLNGNLLAGGFDLKQSRYVGVIIAANKETWAKIPSSSITYAMAMINDQCGTPKGVFKGIYTVDSPEPVVKVYSMFSGLGLPESRVSQLKKEAQEHTAAVKNKDDARNLNLQLDTGVNETVTAAQKVKEKMAQKASAFGKLVGGVVDRRK
jgi:cell division GTPase FtsZ